MRLSEVIVMSLQYNILWVDDRKEEYQSLEMDGEIKSYVQGLFFNPCIDMYDNIREAEEKAPSKKYDVIFSDYNIGEGGDGLDFITAIRKKSVNAEVLFYSALHNPPATNLDRISFLRLKDNRSYDELKEKMKSVINLTLEKLNDLSNLRGLVMSEVSELDVVMKKIVSDYCNDSENEKNMRDYIVGTIEERNKTSLESSSCKKQCTHVWRTKNIKDVVFKQGFESYTTARAINYIVQKIKAKDSESDIEFNLESYKSEIIDNRNILAHCQAAYDAEGNEILKTLKEDKKFNFEDIINIRKNIIKYHNVFKNLSNEVSSNG